MYITYKLCLIFLFSLIIANNFSYAENEYEDDPEDTTGTIETTSVSEIKTTEHEEINTEEEKEEQEDTEKIKNDVTKISKETKKKSSSIKMYQNQQQEAQMIKNKETSVKMHQSQQQEAQVIKNKQSNVKMYQSQQQEAEFDEADDSDTSSNSDKLQLAPEKPITTIRTTVSPTFKEKTITSYPIKVVAMPTFKSLFGPLPGLPAFEPMSMSMDFMPFSGNNTFPNFEPMKPMKSIKDMMSKFPSLYPTKPPNNTQLTTASEDNH